MPLTPSPDPDQTPPDAAPAAPDWPALRPWFDRLAALDAPARAAALAGATLDAASQAELQSLLAHHDRGGDVTGFLQAPALVTELAHSALAGQPLGPWQLLRPLGAGGMGEVWLARRADGAFDAEVAVKLLRRGQDTAQVLARFAQEQQALARLDHPHIARLLDAGHSDDGRPYFVMERVAGEPIDRACRALPLPQRLGLFLQLTDAVAHAHRQLLVHRDLKPGNVMVTPDGQVKLLDFGIAKALDPLEGADAELTQAGQRPFTPIFASPEQVRGEPVGTATDVYSLGVLLYVLLTGVRPYGRGATTAQAAAQAVLGEEPTRPSGLPDQAVDDPLWPQRRRRLRGDLDQILLMALRKDPARRYASVDALAADIRAHLAGYPVAARAPRLGYLVGRFVSRHRAAVGVAAVSVVALLATLAALALQVQATDVARRDAERRFMEVRQLAGKLVFDHHDRIATLAGATAVREALLADAVQYLDRLSRELPPAGVAVPAAADAAQAALARELAETYHRVAALQGETFSPSQERLAAAEAHVDKAIALLPRYVQRSDTPVAALNVAADIHQQRAGLLARRGQLQASLAALEPAQALAEAARTRAPDDPQVLARLATLHGRQAFALGSAASQANLGRLADAGAQWQRALPMFDALVARQPDHAEWQHQLGWALSGITSWAVLSGDAAGAMRHGQRLLAVRDGAAAAAPGNQAMAHQASVARVNLGVALSAAGRHDEALALLDQADARMAAAAAADAANRSLARDRLLLDLARARMLHAAGRPAEAAERLGPVLAGLPSGAGLGDDFFMRRWRAEALVWQARCRPAAQAAAALTDADEALDLMATARPDADNAARRWMQAQAHGERAQALARLGRKDEAHAAARTALAAWGSAAPGGLLRWQQRDRELADGG
ncbi:MAG: protein kinase domain-containing protein [Aquabacterium sp.]